MPMSENTGAEPEDGPGDPATRTDAWLELLLTAPTSTPTTPGPVDQRSVGYENLRALWQLVGSDDEALFDDFSAAVMQVSAAAWPAGAAPPDELGLRVGAWRIDLTKAGIRTGLLTAVIAAALAGQGLSEFSIGFATAVLPTVVDIERIELSKGDQLLVAELRLMPAFQEGWATADELYAALPPHVRKDVNRYDFADFVERLRELGEVDGTSSGLIRVRPAKT